MSTQHAVQRQRRAASARVIASRWAPQVAVVYDTPLDALRDGCTATVTVAMAVSSNRRDTPMPVEGKYYTVQEAAEMLDVTPRAIHDAIKRERLAAVRLGKVHMIEERELQRYRNEVHGAKGWKTRKAEGYTPDETRRQYQQAYRARKKAQQHAPDEKPADIEGPTG